MEAHSRFHWRLRQLAWALPIPILLIAVDLIVRGEMIAKLPPDFKRYYLGAIVFEVFFWYAALGFINALARKSRALAAMGAIGLAAFFCGTVVATYAFFSHFNALPNVFVFEYILDEPRDCWTYARAAMQPTAIGVGICLVLTVALLIYLTARRPGIKPTRLDLVINGAILLLLCLFMNNNVRMGPNAFTPDIHAVFSLTRALYEDLTGATKVEVVSAGAREHINRNFGKLPFNVLLILNESMRAKSLSEYGYFRDTTPHLREFFQHHADSTFRFDRSYANATKTMLAFPSFYTGIVPSQPGGLLHHVPTLFDYGRSFTGVSEFMISTQSMHWGNFDRFLDLPRLPFSWYKETSELAHSNDDRFESLDDKLTPDVFARFLANRDQKTHFFGSIQFTNTHNPYWFDKESDIWHDERLTNNYDNSVHYNDRQFGRVMALLRAHDLLQNTLIISTSDHGEAFGEHGYYGHLNTFYDEEARVPLWIHLPDQLAKNKQLVDQLRANEKASVSNADVIPTMLSLVTGARYGELAEITRELAGSPLDQALPGDDKRAILMQNYNDVDEKTMFVGMGLLLGKYKYLLKFNQARGEEELYDLDADPKEVKNIWDSASPALRAQIYSHLERYKNSRDLLRKAFPRREQSHS